MQNEIIEEYIFTTDDLQIILNYKKLHLLGYIVVLNMALNTYTIIHSGLPIDRRYAIVLSGPVPYTIIDELQILLDVDNKNDNITSNKKVKICNVIKKY